MTPAEQAARLEGQMAAIKRVPAIANPHPLGTVQNRAWAGGWREIAEVRA